MPWTNSYHRRSILLPLRLLATLKFPLALLATLNYLFYPDIIQHNFPVAVVLAGVELLVVIVLIVVIFVVINYAVTFLS